MPFQPTRSRPLAAGIAGFAIALAMTISLVAPALADTPPPLLGYKDDGQTSFVAPTTTGCSYGVDEFANTYYEQGWVPVPAGVHHVMVGHEPGHCHLMHFVRGRGMECEQCKQMAAVT